MSTLTLPKDSSPVGHITRKNAADSRANDPGGITGSAPPVALIDTEALRECAWEIAEMKPADAFVPTANHAALAMVSPSRGFAHWRILDDWIWRTAEQHGDAWRDCRMVLRLYDVSYLEFDGLNANRIQDHELPATRGQMLFDLHHCSGTWQLAEAGFLLRGGEFLPAARSNVVSIAAVCPSSRDDHTAVLVDDNGTVEEVGSIWDQEKILKERRTPKLRTPLRIAVFAFPSSSPDPDRFPTKFTCNLATGLAQRGHQLYVFSPACPGFRQRRQTDGVGQSVLDAASG